MHLFVFADNQLPGKNAIRADDGPYAGIYITEDQHSKYESTLNDLDVLKERNRDNAPVLIAAYDSWMYLYTQSPIATYTSWYTGKLYADLLTIYYKQNTEKIPRCIYISALNYYNEYDDEHIAQNIQIASELFSFTMKKLTAGVLLTVTDCEFS